MLTSPNGKIYIGQTTRPITERFKQHLKKSSGCVAISNAIQKYGWENFEKDWYECPDEDLNFDEDLLVREMGTLSPGGYNLMEGGGNGKHSEDTKQKMRKPKSEEHKKNISEALLGRALSDDHKQKMSEANIGKTLSEDTKKKLSEAQRGDKNHMYGKTHTEATKQKLSEAHLGKTHSEKTKRKIGEAQRGEKHHNSKRVYQYDLEENLINSFGSMEEAARHLKKKASSGIRACAVGDRKTAYGFKWSYEKVCNQLFLTNFQIQP